jgi:excisionase family DNA binding protein
MARRPLPLTEGELTQAFAGPIGERYGPILSPSQLAELLNLSIKTVYEWLSRGRLEGASRRRGKRVLILRDRALQLLISGPDWK